MLLEQDIATAKESSDSWDHPSAEWAPRTVAFSPPRLAPVKSPTRCAPVTSITSECVRVKDFKKLHHSPLYTTGPLDTRVDRRPLGVLANCAELA